MSLIPKESFVNIISIAAIDYLTGGDDTIIDTAVQYAYITLLEYVTVRYPTDVFLIVDGTLNPVLDMQLKDMAVYHLHSRHPQRPMPAIRQLRYDMAIQWCKDVKDEKIKPLLIPTGETISYVISGTNEKRENYQT